MNKDIAIHSDNDWFRYRTGAFVENNGKFLFIDSDYGDYYYMIGGAVTLGEKSSECIEREVFEESGIKARADLLCVVCENFFDGKGGVLEGKDCHVIEFYYRMKVEDISGFKQVNDEGEKLVWLSVEEIKKSVIKPSFIPERIDEILSTAQTIHIVEERDRSKKASL